MLQDPVTPEPALLKPRVRFIWNCILKTDGLAIFVAVIVFIVVAIPMMAAVVTGLHSTAFARHPLVTSTSIILCFAIGIGTILATGRLMRFRKRSWNRFRVARLERLLKHPEARTRFPHRLVEFHHYSVTKGSGGLKKHLARMQPGEVVVIDCPRILTEWLFRRSQSAFEPIPFDAGEERLSWLLSELPDPSSDPRLSALQCKATVRERVGPVMRAIFTVFCVVIGIGALVKALLSGGAGWAWGLGYPALVFAIVAIDSLLIGRRYFLVPGGLVCLVNGLLYRTPRLELYTPRNSSLVLYADGRAFLITQGRVKLVGGFDGMELCLMLAWLNEARTPTIQELRTLLTPESIAAKPVTTDA